MHKFFKLRIYYFELLINSKNFKYKLQYTFLLETSIFGMHFERSNDCFFSKLTSN